jgi:N-acylneuraminate cytidylyltransferase
VTAVAVIPARAGSKGVPGKNSRLICGKPLVAWSIQQALATSTISRVIVSTDSESIADVARSYGAEVPGLRPDCLAGDETPTDLVLIDALQRWCPLHSDDLVVLLQPTSPLRFPASIAKAVETLVTKEADSLVSVCESHAFYWKEDSSAVALYDFKNRPRRQDLQGHNGRYRENGSIYVTKVSTLLSERNRLGGNIALYCMQQYESWEIDSEEDFQVVELLMRRSGF